MTIQRFYDGISNVSADDPKGQMPYLSPTLWTMWYEDFTEKPETTIQWLHTQTNGTLASTSTGGCGIITQTLAGADDDLSQLALSAATITFASTKKLVFETRVKIDKGAGGTIGQQEFFAGLATVQVGVNFTAADGLTMTADDCVGFWSPDGTTSMQAIVRATDVESTQTAAGVNVDATWMTLAFYFDGTNVIFYKNGTSIATLANYPTAGLTPTVYIKAGEAFAAVLSTDYIMVARER